MKVVCSACGKEQERMVVDQADGLTALTCSNCDEPIPMDHLPEEPVSTEAVKRSQNATGALSDILVIDDNHDFLETMQQLLETSGYTVRTALDGKEGLEQIKNKIPDILLVDLIMPKISGEQLIEYIRTEADLKDIPIVVISGALREYSDHDRIGADFYIEKGADLDKKVIALCEHIKQQGRTAIKAHPEPDKVLTQRKIVEELLNDRRKTRQILANLKDGLILYDYDHKVLEVNKTAAALLHQPQHLLLGSPLTKIFPDPYGESIAALMDKAFQDPDTQDRLLMQTDGKTLDLQLSTFKNDKTGQIIGGLIMLYDLTHEQKAKEKLEKKLLELDLLNKVARLLNSSLSEEVVFRAMLERAVNLLGAEAGAIALLDEKSGDSHDFVLQYAFGEAADQVQGIRLDVTQGLIGWVISNSQPLLVNNVSEDERFFRFIDHQSGFQTRSAVCVPIKSNKKIIGVIEILNKRKGAFSSSDLSLLSTIVEVAALSIKNSRLHRDILTQRDYYSNMIEALDEGIIVISRDATILDVNQFFLTFFGRSRNEVIGQKFQHFFSQIEFSYLQQIFENSEESAPGQRFMKTWSCRDNNGELRHFNVSGIPIRLQGHTDNLALMTFHDITRLRKLNEYLESSAAVAAQLLKKEKTMEQIPEILQIMGNTSNASRCYWFNAHHDLNGRLLVSLRSEWCADGVDSQLNNSRFQNVLFEKEYPRWAAELTEGRIISGAVAGFPDHERAELKAQGIKSILILPLFVSAKFDGFIGFDNYRKDTPWQEAEINLLRSGTDSLAKALEHETSRSEKTKLQKQLQHSQRMECMGELSTGISHNFRNILTGIISNTQHFQIKYKDNPELKEFSTDVLNLARMGSDLIGSLLQFSRQDTEDDKKILNLADILNDAYQLIAPSFDKKIEIQCKWPICCPSRATTPNCTR